MLHFRDPVHGFIDVTESECAVVDTAAFQRLRRIKQLATTYLVYHGAEHTRFGHSLGVMHLTSRVFDSVLAKNPDLFGGDPARRAYYRQLLRLVGLTHDLGHPPFSHASEDLFANGREHEDYTHDILFSDEMAAAIDVVNADFQREHGTQFQISPEAIWLAYTGDDIGSALYQPDFPFLKSLMDSELDCDKMDYLLRDSHYCGVNYGNFDLDRLVDSFTVYRGKDSEQLKLAIDSDGVQAVEEFILARYFMFIQVYFHKTRRLLDMRLIGAMRNILPNGIFPMDIQDYLAWDDARVINELAAGEEDSIANPFLQRETMHCFYSSHTHTGPDGKRLYDMIGSITKDLLMKQPSINADNLSDYYFSDSPKKAVHKISPDIEDERGIPVIREGSLEPSSLLDESILLDSLRDNEITMHRLYVSSEYREMVELELSNHL